MQEQLGFKLVVRLVKIKCWERLEFGLLSVLIGVLDHYVGIRLGLDWARSDFDWDQPWIHLFTLRKDKTPTEGVC